MTYPFNDPGEPGDLKASLKAKDLINKPCLIRVTGRGEWEAKPAELNDDGSIKKRAQGPRPYLECDVVVLGMEGIEEHAEGVRISWMRVIPQLENLDGWTTARPKEQDDNSVILMAFNEAGKAKAAELMAEVELLFPSAVSAEGGAGAGTASRPKASAGEGAAGDPSRGVPAAPPAYADGEEPFDGEDF